jgi:hypothetical protein
MRPFRFSVMAGSTVDGTALMALARRAEDLGYDAFMVPDHVGRQLAPIAALATVAAATTRLRIAPFVFANDFRHPLILAGASSWASVPAGASPTTASSGCPMTNRGSAWTAWSNRSGS